MPHILLFTGHMIDRTDRPMPRFPPAKQGAAAFAIRTVLQQQVATYGAASLRGIAAAACGGDILFHEACRDLHIPGEIWLGIPPGAFEQTSVAFAGPDWVARYRKLVNILPVHVLHPGLDAGAPDSVWEEANQWMLTHSLATGGWNMTLIALWDGMKGDGMGGAEHMVGVAGAHHATIEIINVATL